ncbi:MAG: hypothetical protein ACPL2N_07990, partial [Candidatus Cryosericum sp.]
SHHWRATGWLVRVQGSEGHMARKLLSKRVGESLVELAISIAVLSLIMLWAVSAFGAYTKTGQDLDSVGGAMAAADTQIEVLKTYTLTQLNATLPASGATSARTEFSPPNNYQYTYTRATDKVYGSFTLLEVSMTVYDRTTGAGVYAVKTSFLRSGDVNVGD